MTNDDRIALPDAIRALRNELTEAISAAEDEALKFTVDGIQMEFEVEATRAAGGEASIRFWIFNAGANASRSMKSTQRITLDLKASSASGDEVQVTSLTSGAIG